MKMNGLTTMKTILDLLFLFVFTLSVSYQVNADTAIYYVVNDHLGTPELMTDDNQTVVWRKDKTPFGDSVVEEDPDSDGNTVDLNVRFPGQYYDQETGLHYNWHRYYNPKVGRYITSDPIGLDGGINTYGYAGQNPVNQVDPKGLVNVSPEFSGSGPQRTIYPPNMHLGQGNLSRDLAFTGKIVGTIVGTPIALASSVTLASSSTSMVSSSLTTGAKACKEVVVKNKKALQKGLCGLGIAMACATGRPGTALTHMKNLDFKRLARTRLPTDKVTTQIKTTGK